VEVCQSFAALSRQPMVFECDAVFGHAREIGDYAAGASVQAAPATALSCNLEVAGIQSLGSFIRR
jgi:hypothetical protein